MDPPDPCSPDSHYRGARGASDQPDCVQEYEEYIGRYTETEDLLAAVEKALNIGILVFIGVTNLAGFPGTITVGISACVHRA